MRNRSAFTLIELLVAMGLAAMLATISVGGYFAASRGMAERGAIQDTAAFIGMVQQRAFIDGVPVAVFFYNQRLRRETDTEPEIVVGSAVAVRYAGRITKSGLGNYVVDEFADWGKTYPTEGSDSDPGMRFYSMNMSDVQAGINSCCSLVVDHVEQQEFTEYLPWLGMDTNIVVQAFKIKSGKSNWRVGDAYGFEFATIQLPHNFIFGQTKPSDANFDSMDVQQLFFDPSTVTSDSTYTMPFQSVTISELRLQNGGLTPKKIGSITESDIRQ